MMIQKLVSRLSVLGLLIILPHILHAAQLDHWHWRNPLPQGEPISAVAYGNNTFVAVGASGTIFTSNDDGETWTYRKVKTTYYDTNGISYGNGTFVAVGAGGTIFTSNDNGVTWTFKTSGTTESLNGISYGNGTFVAVGDGDTILTSDNNGLTWTSRTSGTDKWFNGISYSNGTFVAVGGAGTIVTSDNNGVTWTSRTSGTTNTFNGIGYGNGTFAAVGGSGTILTSDDNGVTWNVRTSGVSSALYGISYGNGTFVAVGLGSVILSSSNDGETWTSRNSGTNFTLNGISYGNGTFVAVGWYGAILTSPDGVTWTSRISRITEENLEGISYGNGTFVAVGWNGTILTSSDGETWIARTSGTASTLLGISYGNGIFVAVGGQGTILTSSDGVTWTSNTSGTTSDLSGVSYGNGTFVTVGESGKILTSSDGVTWTSRTSGTGRDLFGVGYGNGTFVAVGESGKILTSSDGVTWTSRTSGTDNPLFEITYGNGTFVAVGGVLFFEFERTIVTSSDGVTWTDTTLSPFLLLSGITHANDTFVAVGYGTVIASPDGVTWTDKPGTGNWLMGISYGNDSFVAVGLGGTILQSNSLREQYTLTVTKAGTGSGTVTSSPAGINCGSDCSEVYDPGTSVTLTPAPDSGSTFTGWSGACSGSGTCTVNMTSDKAVTATFTLQQQQYALTVTKSGTGSGTVTSSPAGINCGSDCSETYSKIQKVKLTAKADANSTFAGWSGGGCSGTKTCTVTVDTAITVTADFALKIPDISVAQTTLDFGSIKLGKKATKTLKIANNGTGDLSITLSGLEGTDFSIQGSSSVTIKAKKSYNLKVLFTPKTPGFTTATLNIDSNDPDTPELNIALSGSTVEQPQQYTLAVTKAGTGSGTVTSNPAGINCGADCSEVYNYGTTVTLTANPDAGSAFTGWSGDCSGTGACVVSMTSDKAATATFAQQQYTLTVTKAGTGSGTVTSSPAGINCGADCSEAYNPGTSVTLTATPDSGSTFTGWSGDCSGTGACILSMTSDRAATATFAVSYDGTWDGITSQGKEFSLTVTNNGIASVKYGISCGFTELESTTNYPSPVQLIGNRFSVAIILPIWNGITTQMHTVTINGTFNSPNSASGTIAISGPVCSASGTWNAAK
jgi:photosystem II stability/assembly factor-like uncharacterized protein